MSPARKTKRASRSKKTNSRSGPAARSKVAGSKLLKPVKVPRGKLVESERDEGPSGWFLPTVEAAYTRLGPRAQAVPKYTRPKTPKGRAFASTLQSGQGESVLANISQTAWTEALAEYKRRKVAPKPPEAPVGIAAPVVPGGRNWLPLGPTVVLNGQTVGNQ